MRRVRATFLLRCVILAGSVALVACVVSLAQGSGWSLGTLGLLAVLWFVGIEVGVVPLALEQVAVRRAARSGAPVSSIWFVDLDEQRRRDLEHFHDSASDNPTIR